MHVCFIEEGFHTKQGFKLLTKEDLKDPEFKLSRAGRRILNKHLDATLTQHNSHPLRAGVVYVNIMSCILVHGEFCFPSNSSWYLNHRNLSTMIAFF